MRLDSFGYRLIWQLKRRLYRYRDHWGPRPIIEREPCRHFVPPASVTEAVRRLNCPEQSANLDRLCAQLQIVPRFTAYLPKQLEERDWHQLLGMHSLKERVEYLGFLIKRSKMKLKSKRKKQQMRTARSTEGKAGMEEEDDDDEHELGTDDADDEDERTVEEGEETEDKEEGGDEQCHEDRKDESSSRQWEGHKAIYVPYIGNVERVVASHRYIRSLQLAETPRVAIDCRFLSVHTSRGLNLTMRQLQMLLSVNRDRACPWPIHLCNFSSPSDDAIVDGQRRKHLSILDAPRCVTGELHTASYRELFPELLDAQKIIYLSPHAAETLIHVDADACYVVGAIVDRAREPRIQLKASLLVSELEQLPCRRLPIPPEFLRGGNQMLTLVQVVAILQHVFHSTSGDDWQGAFEQHIPTRKRLCPAEKNQLMRLRYTNIHAYNREVVRIVEERTRKATEEAHCQKQRDKRNSVGTGLLNKLFG